MNGVSAAYAIEVRGLFQSFDSPGNRGSEPTPVLEDISLSLPPGAFVTLVGPSGGGKSTLLNILAGIEPIMKGEVNIEGRPPRAGSSSAYMQQNDLLLPWRTLWDNVLLAPELRSRREYREKQQLAARLLVEFGLDGFQRHYPAQLSGGMRQRAALIRTLLCDRPVLLLDEPFGALDAITRRRLQRLLLSIWRDYKKTVLLVTHDVDEALFLSERVVVLSGTPGRLLHEFPVPLPNVQRAGSPEILDMKMSILARLENGDG